MEAKNRKLILGLVLVVGAWLTILVGLLLTFTGIGACIGIPAIVAAVPFWIWGLVWLYQWKFGKAQELISTGVSAGIKQGLESARSVPASPDRTDMPPSPQSRSNPPTPPQSQSGGSD